MGHEGTGACIQCKYQCTVIVEVWMLTIFCKNNGCLCSWWKTGTIDAPSYTFVKLNPDSKEDRATVNKYWEGDFNGKQREVKDGKIFK